jgi:hypothetical protein
MRKQSRLTSLFAVLFLATIMFAADLFATTAHASAQPLAHRRVVVAGVHHRYYRSGRVSRRFSRRRFVRRRRSFAVAAIPTGDVWFRLRWCESGSNYGAHTGNGYFGAYQFALGTWRGLGYAGYPHEAPPGVQDEAAQRLQARSGWGQWPVCSRRIGAR